MPPPRRSAALNMWLRAACALWLCALAHAARAAHARHDDDFAFDTNEEFRAEISNTSEVTNGLKRLWGVPDSTAYVGRLFRVEIPNAAFSGNVVAYKVRGADGRRAPGWLAVDSRHGLLSGVPLSNDVGSHALQVTAYSDNGAATDTFTIEVKKTRTRTGGEACGARETRLTLLLLLDVRLHQLKPKQRTRALMNLASFMALDGEDFLMESFKSSSESHTDTIVLQSGPGSSKRRSGECTTTAIYLDVGCGTKLWPRHKVLVWGARTQARDGTLAHTLELPVLGWRLLQQRARPVRPRRQAHLEDDTMDLGSGEYEDDADYEDYYSGDGNADDDDDYNSYDPPTDKPNILPGVIPTQEGAATSQVAFNKSASRLFPPSIFSITSVETPISIVPVAPTTVSERIPNIVVPDPETVDVITTPNTTPTSTTMTTTTMTTTVAPTNAAAPATTATVTTESTETTEKDINTPTEKPSTFINGTVTEIVDFPVTEPQSPATPPPNQPPHLSYHMKKLAVTAGKAFRYLIPVDLFVDAEDGTSLTYSMSEADGTPLKPNSWVQFMPDKREVYGLPLEEHVSRWSYTVQAMDGHGAATKAPLDITIQHHKGQRTLNHQFTITLKVQHKYRYGIDWQIEVLEGLVNLFRSKDMEHIIVRDVSTADDLVTFSWSDDTLAKDSCPSDDIQRIMAILESDTEKGSPSANLSRVMQPHLKVSSVTWAGLGACATTPPPPGVPPNHDSLPPMPRNPVDLVRATAGHLLVYKVPADTFYDPGDGDTRHLKLSLVREDNTPLPSAHWMQFDQANQEFYGLPTDRDIGRKEYQLIAEDRTGRTANDVLIVEVNPAPAIQPPVEFHMTMTYPYATLASSALAKRNFLESLAQLFGDKDASAIRVKSITNEPTTVIWYNTSLPMDRCPDSEIEALKRVLIKQEVGAQESLTDLVHQVLEKQDVMSARLVTRGACMQLGVVPKPPPQAGGVAEGGPARVQGLSEYLLTYVVPGIVVVCMILVAGGIACVLYRRRKAAGKMSIGDEEECQAFRPKGIPVIFQDELEDKPDPSNKSPVIMKEEKPPLLPPPDYKPDADSPTPSHHTPYRPPPPFTASRDPRHSRPKATPTYRKPPPYVPP